MKSPIVCVMGMLLCFGLGLGLAAQTVPGNVAFNDAGARLLKTIFPSGMGPEDNAVTVSVVDERAGSPNRETSTEGFITSVLIQQVSFAAAPQTAAWQVIEGDFIVNALTEKEKAAEKDISWENYGNFDVVKYVLSCDAKKAGANWQLTLRLVDLQKGTNKGSSVCTVTAKEIDTLVKAHTTENLPTLRNALKQSLAAALKKVNTALKKKSGENASFAAGNLLYAEKDVGGPVAQFLSSELEVSMSEVGKIARLPGGERPSSAALSTLQSRFPDSKFDGIIEGRYFDEGDSVRLYWTMLAYPSGDILASDSTQFKTSDLPSGLALEPPANPVPSYTINNVTAGANVDKGFKIEASINHGNGGLYFDGELLQVWVKATRDCYIKIYHFDVNGQRQLIFPNQYMKDNFIHSGSLLPFPGPNAPFSFLLGAPFGTEIIKVVASTTPFLNSEADFTQVESLGTGAQNMTRGLVVAANTATAEAKLSYNIQAKPKK